MKHTRILLGAITAATLMASATVSSKLANNWVRIAKTPQGSVYYIDADQKGKGRDDGGPYVVADFIVDESRNSTNKQASTFLKYQVRCGPKTYKLVHLATFDDAGKVIQAGEVDGRLGEGPYLAAPKGTIGETLVRRACEVANSK